MSPPIPQTYVPTGIGASPYAQTPAYVQFEMAKTGPVKVVSPDRAKMVLKLVLIFGTLAALCILAILFVGAGDLINMVLETFGMSVSQGQMLLWTGAAFVLLALAGAAYSLAIPGSARYEFYPDRLVARVPSGIALSTLQASYMNIASISADTKDAFASVLGTGSIVITLTGLDRPQLLLAGVDNPVQTVAEVQQALSAYTTLKVAQFEANARIDRIMSKE